MCLTFLTWAFPFVRQSVFHSGVLDELECAKEGTLSIFSRPICIFPRKKTACYFMSHICDLCLDLHCTARVLMIRAGKKDKRPLKWVNLFRCPNRRCCKVFAYRKVCLESAKALFFFRAIPHTRPQDVFTSTPFINNAFSIFHIQTSAMGDKLVKQMEIQLLQLSWHWKWYYIRKDSYKSLISCYHSTLRVGLYWQA